MQASESRFCGGQSVDGVRRSTHVSKYLDIKRYCTEESSFYAHHLKHNRLDCKLVSAASYKQRTGFKIRELTSQGSKSHLRSVRMGLLLLINLMLSVVTRVLYKTSR